MRDKMAEKKVMMWAKERGIMRDKMPDKKVMMITILRTTYSLCGPR